MFHSTHTNVLVDTQWVIEHLNDPNVRLVESGMTAESYNAGHIPGAVFWSATGFFNNSLPKAMLSVSNSFSIF